MAIGSQRKDRENMPVESNADPFMETDKDTADAMESALSGLIDRLTQDYHDRVSHRRIVEQRWILDLRQFEGRDDDQIVADLINDNRSAAVINMTRAKCNTFESKLYDMLFPTDDRNWGINPTPVPELDREEKELYGEVDGLVEQANLDPDDAQAEEVKGQADQLAGRIGEIETEREEARGKSDLMAEEIADNLIECEHAVHCRNLMHDATTCGTGVLKGPIPLSERVRKNWIREDGGVYRLRMEPDAPDRFATQHISYWNIFPDTTARSPETMESTIERHIMRERDLRDFARQPGVDRDQVRELVEEGPQEELPEFMLQLDTVTEEEQSSFQNKVFVMLEYRGPLESEEMQEIISEMIRIEGKNSRDDGDESEEDGRRRRRDFSRDRPAHADGCGGLFLPGQGGSVFDHAHGRQPAHVQVLPD